MTRLFAYLLLAIIILGLALGIIYNLYLKDDFIGAYTKSELEGK